MNIYRTSQKEQTERAAREAAEWLQVMKTAPGHAEREAFVRWVTSSPLHVRELLLARMLDEELSKSDVWEQFDFDAIMAEAESGNNVVPLSTGSSRQPAAGRDVERPRKRRWVRVAAAAAAVLVVVLTGWAATRMHAVAGVEYATAIGERRTVHLGDGTQVVLAPDSRIRVEFSTHRRRVTLRRGEAEFDVVHDRARPFQVDAGASIIQDIGTRFNVNRLPSGTIVSVSEGVVEISAGHLVALDDGIGTWVASWLPARVAAIERPGTNVEPLQQPVRLEMGEAAHIASNGRALARTHAGVEPRMPADADRLKFHDDTLADIAAEFNRYNARQIVIEDGDMALQRYSGVFDATDVDSFLQFIRCCSRLSVTRQDKRIVVGSRASAPAQQRRD